MWFSIVSTRIYCSKANCWYATTQIHELLNQSEKVLPWLRRIRVEVLLCDPQFNFLMMMFKSAAMQLNLLRHHVIFKTILLLLSVHYWIPPSSSVLLTPSIHSVAMLYTKACFGQSLLACKGCQLGPLDQWSSLEWPKLRLA